MNPLFPNLGKSRKKKSIAVKVGTPINVMLQGQVEGVKVGDDLS